MPPRYSYWTIIAGGLPTAFRATDREDLLPTLSQIRRKHPDAQLKWFARGKLWDSPESARLDTERRRAKQSTESRGQALRGRDWRPGGEHRDPRQKYKDAKKAGNARERKRKFERKQRFGNAGEPRTDHHQSRPHGPQRKWGVDGGHSSSRTGPRTRKPMQRSQRTFHKKSFARNQGPDERPAPPRPEPPEREPRPREGTEPTPPPRPAEPVIPAPGPPERGRFIKKERRRR